MNTYNYIREYVDSDNYERFLGIDPASYKNIGWGLVVHDSRDHSIKQVFGETYTTASNSFGPESAWELSVFLDAIIQASKPHAIIIERTIQFAGNSFVAGQTNATIGVILSVAGRYCIPCQWVLPTHVKKILTGKGKASKNAIAAAVKYQLNGTNQLSDTEEHTYDAVASVLTWLIDNEILSLKDIIPNKRQRQKKNKDQ